MRNLLPLSLQIEVFLFSLPSVFSVYIAFEVNIVDLCILRINNIYAFHSFEAIYERIKRAVVFSLKRG